MAFSDANHITHRLKLKRFTLTYILLAVTCLGYCQIFNIRLDFEDQQEFNQGYDLEFCDDHIIISQPLFFTDQDTWGYGITRIHPEGVLISEHSYTPENGYFTVAFSNCAVADSDGGIFHTGLIDDGSWNIGVIHTDCQGTELESFQYNLGGEVDYNGASIKILEDGSYVVVGNKTADGDVDVVVIRIQSNGSLEWETIVGEEGAQEWGYSIIEVGSKIYIGGSTRSQGGSDSDKYLIKLNADGSFSDDFFIDGPFNDFSLSLFASEDQGFVGVGRRTENVSDVSYPFIALFDENGELLWQELHGDEAIFNAAFSSAVFTSDGNIVACGYRLDSELNQPVGIIVKYDLEGNVIWSRFYQEPAHVGGQLYSIIEAPNGDLIATGIAIGNGELSHDTWVIRTDENGCLHPGCGLGTSEMSVPITTISPNPCSGYFRYESVQPISRLDIVDLQGRIIQSHKPINITGRIEIGDLSPGLYSVLVVYQDGFGIRSVELIVSSKI